MASSDLIWSLVRNNSCFLKKQKNIPVFTSEPNNVSGLNAFKYSGLANKKAVGVSAQKTGGKEAVVLSTTSVKKSKRPCKAVSTLGLSKCPKKGVKALEKALGGYRKDLAEAALAKYKKVLKTFKKPKEQQKSRRNQE